MRFFGEREGVYSPPLFLNLSFDLYNLWIYRADSFLFISTPPVIFFTFNATSPLVFIPQSLIAFFLYILFYNCLQHV